MSTETFENLMATLTMDGTVARGYEFELVSTYALLASNDFGGDIAKVESYSDWATRTGNPTRDTGVDQVATTKDGDLWAIQNKGYAADRNVDQADYDSFVMKATSMPGVTRMILVTSGQGLNVHARARHREHGSKVIILNREWLHDATDYPATLDKLRKAKPKPDKPLKFRDDQLIGIDKCVGALRDRPEAQMWRFCGTGKTIMSVGIADRLGANNVAYFIPWLSLMKQSIRSVRRQYGKTPVTIVAVCSDDTVGGKRRSKNKPDADHIETTEEELAVEVVHTAEELAAYVNEHHTPGRKLVVFCTYNSEKIVVDAQHNLGLPEFDFTFLDEAHNLVGAKKDEAAIGELVKRKDDGRNRLLSKYRIYATATPRMLDQKSRDKLEAAGMTIDSQDHESEVYGEVAENYTLRQAIDDKVITDYRVYIVATSQDKYEEMVRNRVFGTLESGRTIDSGTFATLEAMRHAQDEHGCRTFITYHNLVNTASNFADTSNELGHLPNANVVHGKMSATKREGLIRQLEKNSFGILTNAQCLNEGIDIPALDAVVFADPKGSPTDITQAIGRVVRKTNGKELGHVIIPVVATAEQWETGIISDEEIKTYTKGSANPFRTVFEVLDVLSKVDDAVGQSVTAAVAQLGSRRAGKAYINPVTTPPAEDTPAPDMEKGVPVFGSHVWLVGGGMTPDAIANLGHNLRLAAVRRPYRAYESDRELTILYLMDYRGYTFERAETVVDRAIAAEQRAKEERIAANLIARTQALRASHTA